jgi:hypothetical protein
LSGGGGLVGSGNIFPYVASYTDEIREVFNLSDDDPTKLSRLRFLQRKRDYRIPVINRGQKAVLRFLMEALPTTKPWIVVNCDHLGTGLQQDPQRLRVYGVPLVHALVAGLLTSLLLSILITAVAGNVWVAMTVAFVLGAFAQAVSAGAIYMLRFVAKLLD